MKLITWNIQWGRGVDGKVDLERIVQDARALADFDVLCLQEVSSGYPELAGCDGRDQFRELASLLPGFIAIEGVATEAPDDAGRRRRFGNMILSRFPALQVFRNMLPWPAEDGIKSMQRMALEATLDTPLGLIRVTTTHLEYYSERQRHAQVGRLRDMHEEAVGHAMSTHAGKLADGPFLIPPRGAAAILTGDFNMPPDSPDKAWVEAPFDSGIPAYRDAWTALHPDVPHPPTIGLYDREQWPEGSSSFDFIFVTEDLLPRLSRLQADDASRASDHQPVLVELA
ncbi:endonuclease/exonuclease/phosphatase family protein [Noviherbaspirillum galbum]|uniref:Endonuclease n=1 Tax=Noviherbaspirillum galbum TaxID=2709383 RepID=A0A6B3SUL0_9BURK|nr:endonuclease/exonuclease/phosphatase family protein [Noviherbaspirillum galbum]NEX63055.1 endonuclease [Noviherbaspirillum galbum]